MGIMAQPPEALKRQHDKPTGSGKQPRDDRKAQPLAAKREARRKVGGVWVLLFSCSFIGFVIKISKLRPDDSTKLNNKSKYFKNFNVKDLS